MYPHRPRAKECWLGVMALCSYGFIQVWPYVVMAFHGYGLLWPYVVMALYSYGPIQLWPHMVHTRHPRQQRIRIVLGLGVVVVRRRRRLSDRRAERGLGLI